MARKAKSGKEAGSRKKIGAPKIARRATRAKVAVAKSTRRGRVARAAKRVEAATLEVALVPNPTPPPGFDGDVLIQAGHENTPDDKTGGEGPLGREIEWTPIVADEATRILRAAGVSTIREDASLKRPERRNVRFRVKVAVFLHFDDPDSGESGASIGYKGSSDEPAASEWKKLYSTFFPFHFMPDNFTPDESGYYGFKFTVTTDAEFLIEFGDLGSLRQARWMKPRLQWMGALLAHFLSLRIGKGNVPLPEFPGDAADPHSVEIEHLRELHVIPQGLPKRLPDYAQETLGAGTGVPWHKAGAMPQFDSYKGIMPGSCCIFNQLTGMSLPAVTTAIIYESKFAIDSDGSSDASDPDHQSKTSLRHDDGSSLDARREQYGVIPLDAREAAAEGLTKLSGVPDFGGVGLRLGDIGISFWGDRRAVFIYGDKGPPNALGEGSIRLADSLKIPSDPRNGGFNDRDIHSMGKGVMHIAFPGSSDVQPGDRRSRRSASEIDQLGQALFAEFCNQAQPSSGRNPKIALASREKRSRKAHKESQRK